MPAPTQYRNQMLALVEAWQHSRPRRKAFCAEQNISCHRFHYWHQRYKKQYAPVTMNSPAFIVLKLRCAAVPAELIYPNGRRIVFHQGVDAAFLKTLLAFIPPPKDAVIHKGVPKSH